MGLRQERLADEIRDVLGTCFQAGQMEDPRLVGVTITAVKLSGDLQQATVYFRLYEADHQTSKLDLEAQKAKALAGLESASGLLRRKVGDAIVMRRVPHLRFIFDESIARGALIEKLLANLD